MLAARTRARPPLPRARSARRRAPTSPTGRACASPTSPPRSTRSSRSAASATRAGRELLDLPRAPLPAADTPAPVRLLPKWDNIAARARRPPPRPAGGVRQAVIAKNGDVAQTFLVDGVVAGAWNADKKGKSTSTPYAPLPRAARREVEDEAARLEAWLVASPDVHRRASLVSRRDPHRDRPRRGDRRRVAAGLHAEPAHVAADEPRSGELRALPRAARGGRHPRRPLPRALPLQPRGAGRRRSTRSRSRRCATRWRSPARSAPTASSSTSARTSAPASSKGLERVLPGAGAGARALHRRDVAADGELRRRRRHDRPLDRRARDDLRAARPPSAARHLPRLVPPLRLGRRRHRSRRSSTRCSTRSTSSIGLDRLRALHVNDSAAPLGSNRDRHANIGEGLLGEQLGVFLGHPRLQGLPAVLETAGPDKQGPRRERDPQGEGDPRARARAQ